jgi:glutamine synthetase
MPLVLPRPRAGERGAAARHHRLRQPTEASLPDPAVSPVDPTLLASLIRKGEVDTVLTVFPDHLGRLLGKRVVGRYFLDHVLHEAVHACIYLFTVDMEMEPLPGFRLTSWERGYGDMKLVPDLATWRLVPWLPGTALVFCDCYTEDGAPIEEAPRWVLRRQLDRAVRRGFTIKTGSELELYLYRESFDVARAGRYHALTPVSNYLEDYHVLQTSKEEGLVRAIRNYMEAARVPVEFSKGEWGRGQEEINLRYTEALEMADRHALYKHGVKEIAWQQGSSVTFMAKPDMAAAGSSFHVHSSVWDRRGVRNLFAARGARQGSALFGQWVAGQMALARELAFFYAPTVNAYKRYQAGPFAPTRIACGWDNRTCGFRVCGEGAGFRIENRIPGADANPYLAFAATIAAGLHGVEKGLKAPRWYEGNAYEDRALPQVPRTLRDALQELERSRSARAAFGDRVVDHYLRLGHLEQQAFDQAVTDWERLRYFERI